MGVKNSKVELPCTRLCHISNALPKYEDCFERLPTYDEAMSEKLDKWAELQRRRVRLDSPLQVRRDSPLQLSSGLQGSPSVSASTSRKTQESYVSGVNRCDTCFCYYNPDTTSPWLSPFGENNCRLCQRKKELERYSAKQRRNNQHNYADPWNATNRF